MDRRRLSPAEFRFVEHKLYTHVESMQAVVEYERLAADIAPGTSRLQHAAPSNRQEGSSVVEAQVMQLLLIEQKAQREMFWVRAVEDVYAVLGGEDRALVRLKYFERMLSNDGVARELSISLSTFDRRRRDILYRFASRFGLV